MRSSAPSSAPAQAPRQDSRADALVREATRLAGKVKAGELSRTAAADQLNLTRLKLVGPNLVDDNTFAMYRYLAVERDAGRLTQEESQARMEMRLREWMRRWPRMNPRPPEPVFTDFLLKVYGLPALDH
ncbi:hypothetical protein [uncultured Aquitalea sp.]|uniref:hypothetical protein n=1 Tax=uncultured Aquitalea sp. TaxID=540272 RepID=UPI0025D8401E|nr:hypothetical protein [uncultured Aquitalea sp.]